MAALVSRRSNCLLRVACCSGSQRLCRLLSRSSLLAHARIRGRVVLQELAYRDEAVALLLQLGEGLLQRLDGLRAVAAAVVHEDDASRLRFHDAARDGVRSRAPPVFGVDVPSDLGIDVGL